jgi:RNA polymerase sigma-70 factor (ECF subfamily)
LPRREAEREDLALRFASRLNAAEGRTNLRYPIAAGVMQVMDAQLLGKLIDRHAAALVLYARQWCRAPEDVVQEAFVKLAAQGRPPDSIVAWLYRVVRNGAISAARAERRRRHHEGSAAARAVVWFVPAEGVALDGEKARGALEALPLDLREPVVAHLWGGLTFAQIGQLMGCSTATAHRRYLEGLASLRERLGVECPNNPASRPAGRN